MRKSVMAETETAERCLHTLDFEDQFSKVFGEAPGNAPGHDDVLSGYLDGLKDEREQYPEASNRSALYRHGWLNGRDDRLKAPRASAQSIREDLAALLASSVHP